MATESYVATTCLCFLSSPPVYQKHQSLCDTLHTLTAFIYQLGVDIFICLIHFPRYTGIFIMMAHWPCMSYLSVVLVICVIIIIVLVIVLQMQRPFCYLGCCILFFLLFHLSIEICTGNFSAETSAVKLTL